MGDAMLRLVRRISLYGALLFAGSALIVGGLKFYEHQTFIPTQARVVGTSTKCEMSYRLGGRQTVESIIECVDVARFKARYSDDDWKVREIPFVDLVYSVDGRIVRATARLGKLELTRASVGETITVLRSPSNPTNITGPISRIFVAYLIIAAAIGVLMFGVYRWTQIWGSRTVSAPTGDTLAIGGLSGQTSFDVGPASAQDTQTLAPVKNPPWDPAKGGGFGKRAPTIDYVRRS